MNNFKDKNKMLKLEDKKEMIQEIVDVLDEDQLSKIISLLEVPFYTKKLESYILDENLPPLDSTEFLFLTLAYKYNGNIIVKLFKDAGVSDYHIKQMVLKYKLIPIGKSAYVFPNKEIDPAFIFQQQYSKAVVSLESALYALDLTDVIPKCITMSMPDAYNLNQLKKSNSQFIEDFTVKYGLPNIEMIIQYGEYPAIALIKDKSVEDKDIIICSSVLGNKVRITSPERTIVDILKKKHLVEEEVREEAIKRYFTLFPNNKTKLRRVASEQKVLDVLDSYLWKLRVF